MTPSRPAPAESWQAKAHERQAVLARSIDNVKPEVPALPSTLPVNVTKLPAELLPPQVVAITTATPEDLLHSLATGALSATAVTQAFLQRAGLASRLTNCVTELLPERAIARAAWLDAWREKHGRPIGPLHGLPISVKEMVAMAGLDINAGVAAWAGRAPPTSDAAILQYLWNAGAVFYARTTNPQTLMAFETDSNLHGATTNPYNTTLRSGGSSGGEGALVGLRGSVLGVGSDIGGSIRGPAANNGVFGLRPTSNRLPLAGLLASMLGAEHILPVTGPLSTSVHGMRVFMKAVIDQKPWLASPSLVPIPWNDAAAGTLLKRDANGTPTLRVGILVDDEIVKPHPPIQRGLQSVIAKLQQYQPGAGAPQITLIPFSPYKHDDAQRITWSLYFADGGAETASILDASGEPWMPLVRWALKEVPWVRRLSVEEIWDLTKQREGYRAEYAAHWRRVGQDAAAPGTSKPAASGTPALHDESYDIDVLLAPASPSCAPIPGTSHYWNYLAQWNLLDYPAVVFPTGLACNATDDPADVHYVPRNDQDRENWGLYTPEKYADAPISLQLIGRRYEDEKLLQALETILAACGLPTAV